MTYLFAYIASLASFLLIDAVWLGLIAKDFFGKHLSHILAEDINIFAALLFYIFYAGGIVFFAVKPALADQNIMIAVGYGAFLGLLSYGAYDLTNLATVRNWPMIVTIVDLCWGTALTAACAAAGYLAASYNAF